MKTRIFIRADGNGKIGLGHVFRCLALVEMLKQDFSCHFVIRNPIPAVKDHIAQLCDEVIALDDTADEDAEAAHIAMLLGKEDILVLDGYHFRTGYQRIIKESGCKLVCIDDIHAYHFIADAVINHAGGVPVTAYSAEDYTKFYLGPQYALVRRAYFHRKTSAVFNDAIAGVKIFLCMGGADPRNDTLATVTDLYPELEPGTEVHIVVGSGYRFDEELNGFIKDKPAFHLYKGLAVAEMVALMQACNMAVIPASTVAYEYMSGGGVVYLKVIADNQRNIYNYFVEQGMALPYQGHPARISKEGAEKMLLKQEAVFDGKNGERITGIFKTLTGR